ncbi:MAG: SMC-Scp complex subunit ScpB [Verrucomicrobiia bacterium]|jgi:segregation and condensation protein B
MELKEIIEALLFNAQKALTAEEIRNVIIETAKNTEDSEAKSFSRVPIENVKTALEQIEREINSAGRAFRLLCIAGAYQFASRPEFSPWLRTLYGQRQRPPRLSQPALETLAIIAYRQPVTRAEVEQIRGVSVDGVIQTLLERGLIEQSGRAEIPGRPALYSTTQLFLEYFGLKSLDDLPAADELRKPQIQKPQTLLTVDNAAQTAAGGENNFPNNNQTQPDPSPEKTPENAPPAAESEQKGANAAGNSRGQETIQESNVSQTNSTESDKNQ